MVTQIWSHWLENGRRWRAGKVPGYGALGEGGNPTLSIINRYSRTLSFASLLTPPAQVLEPSELPCGVCWTLNNFLLQDIHRLSYLGQAPLPSAGHSWGFSWVQPHLMDATVLCPAELLISWVLEVPEMGGMMVVGRWGFRGLPEQGSLWPQI